MEGNINILGVDPQLIAYLATNLSRIANEYETKVAGIYKTFNYLGIEKKWTGKNYNFIAVNIFNSSKYAIEEWIEYLQTTIPMQIYEIALMLQDEKTAGQLEFSIYKSTEDIKYIDETEETGDGAFKMNIESSRAEIRDSIGSYCIQSNNLLDDYKTQIEQLIALGQQINIEKLLEEVYEVLYKNKSFVKLMQSSLQEIFEKTEKEIYMTEQEAIDLAGSLQNITG